MMCNVLKLIINISESMALNIVPWGSSLHSSFFNVEGPNLDTCFPD